MSTDTNSQRRPVKPIREGLQEVVSLAEAVAFDSGYEPHAMHFFEHDPMKDMGPHSILKYEVASSEDLREVGDAAIWAGMDFDADQGVTAWVDSIESTALINFPNFLMVRIDVTGVERSAFETEVAKVEILSEHY